MHHRYEFSEPNAADMPRVVSLSLTKYEDDMPSLMHSHLACEIIFVQEGEGELVTLEDTFAMHKGDLFLINPNVLHTERQAPGKTPVEYYVVMLENIVFRRQADTSEVSDRTVFRTGGQGSDYSRTAGLFRTMYDELYKQEIYYSYCAAGCVYMLLADIARRGNIVHIYKRREDLSPSMIADYAKTYIDCYYAAPFKMRDLAEKISVSPSQFYHKFKEAFGMSPLEYKMNRQFKEACNLLAKSDFSITQVAMNAGFNNAAYFTKLFRARFGCSPKDYRRRERP